MKTDIFVSGLVSGLTILLGVITADWLRRLRDRINYTRRILPDIEKNLLKFINYSERNILSDRAEIGSEKYLVESQASEVFYLLKKELRDLSDTPRWPQRNAKRAREVANNLRICVIANALHCEINQVLLHKENAEELSQRMLTLGGTTRSKKDFDSGMRLLHEKVDELKEEMLNRGEASPGKSA